MGLPGWLFQGHISVGKLFLAIILIIRILLAVTCMGAGGFCVFVVMGGGAFVSRVFELWLLGDWYGCFRPLGIGIRDDSDGMVLEVRLCSVGTLAGGDVLVITL